jgi:hypothetical protein
VLYAEFVHWFGGALPKTLIIIPPLDEEGWVRVGIGFIVARALQWRVTPDSGDSWFSFLL